MTRSRTPATGSAQPLRRGRPATGHAPFEEATRAVYLELLRHGARLGEAADQLGINRATPARYRRTDREFAAAVDDARAVGAKVRLEDVPHDEYRYNVLKCRCPQCTRAATTGRAGRRAEATPDTDEPPANTAGDIHPIRLGVGESSTSFLLARAS
ncbi:hypothetical protein [Streptomyces cyaneofuscatus]|uniref:hypothetical protein n=1 Tax=Streptomyces cyaneofuscatus TaxID=66883 RepID=UPI0036E2540A